LFFRGSNLTNILIGTKNSGKKLRSRGRLMQAN
jgi:hypothetical protein